MKFLLIIPTHNEEQFISLNLESLKNQNFQDFQCIVVNDGSTDDTKIKIENFIENFGVESQFKLLNLEKSSHAPGAKVVRTFYKGLASVPLQNFDVICKFDADIIFPPNYLLILNSVYESNPHAGMVSGLVYINRNNDFLKNIFDFSNRNSSWKFENLSSTLHVRGPIKSYRKECFISMDGLREVLGWDNIDVMLAKKNGWKVITIKDLWVKHLKPTAFMYQTEKAKKLGIYFYNIGLNYPLALISAFKSALKDASIIHFFSILHSYRQQKHPQILKEEEIAFIRKLRWNEMKNKLF